MSNGGLKDSMRRPGPAGYLSELGRSGLEGWDDAHVPCCVGIVGETWNPMSHKSQQKLDLVGNFTAPLLAYLGSTVS
jgi:hypothetical protein